ncbi:MAG: isopentenyl-diphosphate delta-isomerase [archaeon GW2011_AR3]|nr:MAG: isopentenyl-diphosphate delta-isomerase [archaeon GW2011_AR3]MBS3109892.1 isopentenyl-diphosphate Delta-isomerase [Candidatus Woesearchaeota archaeon]
MEEQIILVDQNDREIGAGEKTSVHKKGLLHRAFSILILNKNGEMLLQQRANIKYHSGGKWSNVCCGHPRPSESIEKAAERRLMEEIGIKCALRELFTFIYKVGLDNGLTEHEFLHVFIGEFNGAPEPNPDEVDNWEWTGVDELQQGMKVHPGKYTYWFKIAFEKYMGNYADYK